MKKARAFKYKIYKKVIGLMNYSSLKSINEFHYLMNLLLLKLLFIFNYYQNYSLIHLFCIGYSKV